MESDSFNKAADDDDDAFSDSSFAPVDFPSSSVPNK